MSEANASPFQCASAENQENTFNFVWGYLRGFPLGGVLGTFSPRKKYRAAGKTEYKKENGFSAAPRHDPHSIELLLQLINQCHRFDRRHRVDLRAAQTIDDLRRRCDMLTDEIETLVRIRRFIKR